MNRSLLILGLSLTMLCAYAQNGIHFLDEGWSKALELAQKEEKIIFLDAYTVWCGPCQTMKKKVFPNKEVGDFYNKHFINIQIDMEQGEGIELAQKYDVQAFPSLIFVSPTGVLLHKSVGYLPPEGLLDLGKTALNPATQLSRMEELFEKGDRDPKFLHDYAFSSYQGMNGQHKVAAKEFLKTQKSWESPEALNIIFLFTEVEDEDMFNFLIEHREAFEPIFGKGAVIQRVQNLILTKAFKSGQLSEEVSLEEVDRLYQKAFPGAAREMSAHFKMNYFNQIGDTENFVKAALGYYSVAQVDDYLELNNIAWRFYELVDDKTILENALEWAKRSVSINSQYFNNDTVAALYYKLGQIKQARKAALKAIEIGKANGENVAGTEALLEKIEK